MKLYIIPFKCLGGIILSLILGSKHQVSLNPNDKRNHKYRIQASFFYGPPHQFNFTASSSNRMQGSFLDSMRVFRCQNSSIVSVNLPIDAKVGFVTPQNVSWPSDINHHSSKELNCKSSLGSRFSIASQASFWRDKCAKSALRFFLE